MRLTRLIREEVPDHLRMLAVMTVAAAVATAALLWLVNQAAQDAAVGTINGSLAVRFIVTIVVFAVTENYVLVRASLDVEVLLHRLRVRLFDAVRRSDMVTLDSVGRAAMQSALTQETQTLARTLPMLVVGAQQAVVLLFLAVYLAWLSPMACVMAFAFAGVAIAVRMTRMVSLGQAMQSALGAELAVFDRLTDMLRGFKEVRMSRRRATGVVADLAAASARSRQVNTETKRRWGWEFALLQSMFYALVGLMVFVVPLFTMDFHGVVVQATIVTLFIVGPVTTLAYVTPMISQTEFALSNVESMTERLRTAAGDAPDSAARPLARVPTRVALRRATFAYRDAQGGVAFEVGPLSAEFRAGEITFITGGNGSGKSTMLRMLTGLVPLAGGSLEADGSAVAAEQMQAFRDQVSAVLSDSHLSRRLYGLRDVEPDRVRAWLTRLEMHEKVDVKEGAFTTVDLSGGQRKRLSLVVALLEDKPVIVLDEWAAGQDPYFRRVFYESLLPELKARGKIVICVTHDDRWFGAADQVLQMDEGRFAHRARPGGGDDGARAN